LTQNKHYPTNNEKFKKFILNLETMRAEQQDAPTLEINQNLSKDILFMYIQFIKMIKENGLFCLDF